MNENQTEMRVDHHVREARMHSRDIGLWKHLRSPFWNKFMTHAVTQIFKRGGLIVDIGGGLRIDASRGNRVNPAHKKRFSAYLNDPNVDYKVTDYTDAYSPDFVEDVHNLSFADASVDSIIAIALLEHVYDPKKACEEIIRVLKHGGHAFVYAPFIYRYHAHRSDYRDYFRYSKDGWAYLFRDCTSIELCPVRGLFETLLRFTPLHQITPLNLFCRFLDSSCKKMRGISAVQTSGYNVFITK